MYTFDDPTSTLKEVIRRSELVTKTFQPNTNLTDVYQFMLSFRYSFN